MDKGKIHIQILKSITDIDQKEWNLCACPEIFDGLQPLDPFTTYSFLSALERSGSVGRGTGWHIFHLLAKISDEIVGVMPLYIKGHSQGEYIFDYNWANAYENTGGQYYPKLQSAVPFTPATGKRFLIKRGFDKEVREALFLGIIAIAKNNKISSAHVTFCTFEEAKEISKKNFLFRKTIQFHWENKGFDDFDDFLSVLTSRKRKVIKKERFTAKSFWNNKGKILRLSGSDIESRYWDYFWTFYQDTGARKWGYPYLTREFFDIIDETMKDNILLILAMENETPIAGALNFLGQNTLFGRYWGSSKYYSCLHYELCYYQAIEYAIENGLRRIEAGAQGEHKLSRGYLPNFVYSVHWFLDKSFSLAVADYLEKEKKLMSEEINTLLLDSPFKN